MRDHSIALAAVILLSVLLAGCGAPLKTVYYGCKETTFTNMTSYHFGDIKGRYCRGKDNAPEGKRKSNFEILRKKYKKEWEYTGKGRPELGVALSGGGTRSASFCIGVLQALQESGALDEVDVISSVSGGSYAAYWYFMQNYYLNRKNFKEHKKDMRIKDESRSLEKENPNKANVNEIGKEDPNKAKFFARLWKYLTSKEPEKEKWSTEWDKIMKGESCVDKICSSAPGSRNQDCRCKTEDDFFDEFENGKILFNDLNYCKNALNNTSHPDQYRFQYYLQYASNIMTLRKKQGVMPTLTNIWKSISENIFYAGSVPVHWVANGVFDGNFNLNPYRQYYQDGIERTYGYVPLTYNFEQFANDSNASLIFHLVNALDLNLSDMHKYLQDYKSRNDKKLPYFIINTTADYANHFRSYKKKKMVMSVYEFTPFGCGSGMTGYISVEQCPDVSIGRAVSISGAAVDGENESIDIAGKSEGETPTLAAALNIFNLDLGYNIRNHDPDTEAWYYWPAKLIPFPFYFLKDLALEERPDEIHLSDGGHIENLGIFSLVRRGVKKIIAVDAEFDPTSIFASLNRLKINLEEEMGLKLEMDWPSAIDVYYTGSPHAIITGRIKGLENEQGKEEEIKLVYIKLSMHKKTLAEGDGCKSGYPSTVVHYAGKHDSFPQESTADIFYSPEQFKAYRDLGYTIAKTCGDRCKKP